MSLLPTIVIMLLIVGGMRHFHLLNNLDFIMWMIRSN